MRARILGVAAALAVLAVACGGEETPTCSDGKQNGAETDVDCGGTCPPCADGLKCGGADDCLSLSCSGGLCQAPACDDLVQNGLETDVDCGATCPPCADGLECGGADDCRSLVCTGGLCQVPACDDQVENGLETDVDCGGPCTPCDDGRACSVPADCLSLVCQASVCLAPTCADGARNGTEPDVDCGGDACAPCADGQACVLAADCLSGVCTLLICQVPACDDGAWNGTETDVDCGGPCPPCTGGKGCAVAADCESQACSGGACQVLLGEPCGDDAACVSGFCADLLCCASACDGTCERCDLPGSEGQCLPAPAGEDPDSECPDEPAWTCGTSGVCSGSGACAIHPAGTECEAATCYGPGRARLARTCDGSGSCLEAGTVDCSPYRCSQGRCLESCRRDDQCVPGSACKIGTLPDSPGVCLQALGKPCTSPTQCASGICADSVCCDTFCGGRCMSCSSGKCKIAPAGQPDDDCFDPRPSPCGRTGLCAAGGTCALQPAGKECAPQACADADTVTLASTCSGTGTCVSRGVQECASLVCADGACLVPCTVPADCAAGQGCSDGYCRKGPGAPCGAPPECASGWCTDGVCCNSECLGVCRRCNAAGICAPVGSETDPDEDCPDDGAESCGRTGVCWEGACALYSDQTVCRSAECNSSFQRVPERFCDGSGVCDEAILETCDDDYACSGGACLTSCASDDDCLNGTACSQQATCQGGKDQQCASDPECASGACCGIITRECKDPESDPYNCGGCANICFGGFGWSGACVSGECVPVCDGGYLDCDGDDHNGCEIWLGAPVLPALATIDLGSHCGDFGCGSHSRCTAVGFDMSTLMGWQEAVGSLAMFAKVKECTTCWFTDLGAHIVLRSPPSADYDLHVFKGILAGTKVGSSTNVGAGVQDALSIRFTDNVLVSEYTYYIVVEWKSGASCEEWRLEIYGTTCP